MIIETPNFLEFQIKYSLTPMLSASTSTAEDTTPTDESARFAKLS